MGDLGQVDLTEAVISTQPGITHVVCVFCVIVVAHNMKVTWEIPDSVSIWFNQLVDMQHAIAGKIARNSMLNANRAQSEMTKQVFTDEEETWRCVDA